jgi:hypothetical protein
VSPGRKRSPTAPLFSGDHAATQARDPGLRAIVDIHIHRQIIGGHVRHAQIREHDLFWLRTGQIPQDLIHLRDGLIRIGRSDGYITHRHATPLPCPTARARERDAIRSLDALIRLGLTLLERLDLSGRNAIPLLGTDRETLSRLSTLAKRKRLAWLTAKTDAVPREVFLGEQTLLLLTRAILGDLTGRQTGPLNTPETGAAPLSEISARRAIEEVLASLTDASAPRRKAEVGPIRKLLAIGAIRELRQAGVFALTCLEPRVEPLTLGDLASRHAAKTIATRGPLGTLGVLRAGPIIQTGEQEARRILCAHALLVTLLHTNGGISLTGTIPVDAIEVTREWRERIAILTDLGAGLYASNALAAAAYLTVTARGEANHIRDANADPLDATLGDATRHIGTDRDLLFVRFSAAATSWRHTCRDHQQRDEQVSFHQREWLWHVSSKRVSGKVRAGHNNVESFPNTLRAKNESRREVPCSRLLKM